MTIQLGARRELFVDHHLIDAMTDARLRLHPPERKNVVFSAAEPLENACTGCFNVVQHNNRVLIYYRGYHPVGFDLPAGWEQSQTANLLTSADGIHFERPSLGLVEADGSRDNNLLLRGYVGHNFCVCVDPQAPPEQRFKAVGGSSKNNLQGFSSPDGLQWTPVREGPLDISGAFDSVNVPLWDPHAGCYRLFSRYLDETTGTGIRAIQSCTSDDFVHWSEPVPHRYAAGVPLEHFYTNATLPCPGAEHILLSFPMRFVPDRRKDTAGMDYETGGISDAVFMTSRNGIDWDRTFMEAWLRPGPDGRNWTHRNQTPAPGIVATAPDEWSLYASSHYGWSSNRLQRLTVRPWGFASLSAGYRGGECTTRPLILSGSTLHLNYATSAVGSMRVEVQNAEGAAIEGFALEDTEPLYGDALDAPWPADFSALRGQTVRLRFVLQDADLFSIRSI